MKTRAQKLGNEIITSFGWCLPNFRGMWEGGKAGKKFQMNSQRLRKILLLIANCNSELVNDGMLRNLRISIKQNRHTQLGKSFAHQLQPFHKLDNPPPANPRLRIVTFYNDI